MNVERLLKLADALDNYVKDEWWDFRLIHTDGFPEHQCGSTACAIGWMPQIMDDPKLTYMQMGDNQYSYYQLRLEGLISNNEQYITSKYLNISMEDTYKLFYDPYTYGKITRSQVTRHDVASKIREYIQNHS